MFLCQMATIDIVDYIVYFLDLKSKLVRPKQCTKFVTAYLFYLLSMSSSKPKIFQVQRINLFY